jgi:hypothetical protein
MKRQKRSLSNSDQQGENINNNNMEEKIKEITNETPEKIIIKQ